MQNSANRIRRIAAGAGGDVTLLIGSEKTAVMDTGMAYCGDKTVEGVARILGDRTLDYVLASHTHYDHIGGLAHLRKRWPGLTALGNGHAKYVLERPGALRTIRQLSEYAALDYFNRKDCLPLCYSDEDMRIDQVVSDGDLVSLGDLQVRILETPGHTNCSLSFHILEEDVLFAGESVGCYGGNSQMVSSILTSYHRSLESIEKCRAQRAKGIISPHYGMVRGINPDEYFDLAQKQAEAMKDFILNHLRRGEKKGAVLSLCKKAFWNESVRKEQPEKAFVINTEAMIDVIQREFIEP